MVWVSEDVVEKWASPRRKTRGGQSLYSDMAIEICLTLRVVFRLPLRQTQGFMRSIAKLMDLDLKVPDFSTLSRRGRGLKVSRNQRASDKPVTIIVDSTGLQMHGGSDWCATKHGGKKPNKTWRKLHIALDAKSGEILESILTTEHVGDETALPSMLAKVDANVERFLADGAYDGQGVFDCLGANFGPDIEVAIPPTAGRLLRSKRREVRKTQSKAVIHSEISTSRTSLSTAE